MLKELSAADRGKNKTPGAVGLPGEVYGANLLPEMLAVFNAALECGHLLPSMNGAIIIVLLKPNKTPKNPESYRPISLLILDVKLLAKVVATRLAKVTSKIVHSDQFGFIPSRTFGQ